MKTKKMIAVMEKFGQPGWTIYTRTHASGLIVATDPSWHWGVFDYIARREERVQVRVPFFIDHYKMGMIVNVNKELYVVIARTGDQLVLGSSLGTTTIRPIQCITGWRWPHETEWQPACTFQEQVNILEEISL